MPEGYYYRTNPKPSNDFKLYGTPEILFMINHITNDSAKLNAPQTIAISKQPIPSQT